MENRDNFRSDRSRGAGPQSQLYDARNREMDRNRSNRGDGERGSGIGSYDRERGFRGQSYNNDRNFDSRKSNFGGRFGGRGGGGGGGAIRHMGESEEVSSLVDNELLNDRVVLDIIDPDITDREDLVLGSDPANPLSRALPPLATWRLENPAGVQLSQKNKRGEHIHILRSNFFRVNPEKIPSAVFHYNIAILPYKHSDGAVQFGDDLALKSDKLKVAEIVNLFLVDLKKTVSVPCGIAYDGASSLYSSRKIPLPDESGNVVQSYREQHQYHHDIFFHDNLRPNFAVIIKFTHEIIVPNVKGSSGAQETKTITTTDNSRVSQHEAMQAMDVALLSFARKKIASGSWILLGNSVFSARDSRVYPLTDQFIGMLGYHASFRVCISGLALVKDISVTCFMKGGSLIQFVATFLKCDVRDLVRNFHPGNRRVADLVDLLKNSTVKTTHLKNGQIRKKFRDFALPADRATFYISEDSPPVSVRDYYLQKHGLRLIYPDIPTINVGSSKREILIPIELLDILPGQTRSRCINGEISSKIITNAAMKPNDRFHALTQGSFLFPALQQDEDAKHFGIANIISGELDGKLSLSQSDAPMRVIGTILPPAKLMYGNRKGIEPKLRGAWNLAGGIQFVHPAFSSSFSNPSARSRIPYGLLAVCDSQRQFSDASRALETLSRKIEAESDRVGVPMSPSESVQAVTLNSREMDGSMMMFKARNVRIVVVLLMDEKFYPRVKFVADSCCMLTQCVRYSMVVKNVRNFETNLLIKMNAKMGGTNHTLASRMTGAKNQDEFQKPPKSISWVFDVPTMVIGIDVNHPDPRMGGTNQDTSVVAVVGSVDGMLSQYCAQISTSSASREPVSTLYHSFVRLFAAFCERNLGQFPRHVVVYRDGVADSQFIATLDSELEALKQAIEHYDKDEDFVKISFVVCQKRHHTRFFYKNNSSEEYLNPCVGLCVDARGFAGNCAAGPGTAIENIPDAPGCVVAADIVEFYLNSHAAVLGTSKPTRYVLLYDGIGFKLSELELLTFWLTHLYARCTRSVSIVAPAYYAHWAARRGRVLLQGSGGKFNSSTLKEMSDRWLDDSGAGGGMYFL